MQTHECLIPHVTAIRCRANVNAEPKRFHAEQRGGSVWIVSCVAGRLGIVSLRQNEIRTVSELDDQVYAPRSVHVCFCFPHAELQPDSPDVWFTMQKVEHCSSTVNWWKVQFKDRPGACPKFHVEWPSRAGEQKKDRWTAKLSCAPAAG